MNKATSRATAKRIKAVHGRARLVGILYLLASIAMAVFTCLPLLKTKSGSFETGVLGFYKPIIDAVKNGFSITLELVAAVLYILVLLTVIINMFRSFANLKPLFKKGKISGSIYRSGYSVYSEPEARGLNDNQEAMDTLGNIFSGSFAVFLIIHFFLYLLLKETDSQNVEIGLLAYVAFGVGLFFHFLCGMLGTKVSYFQKENSDVKYFFHYSFTGPKSNLARRTGVSVAESTQLHERRRVCGASVFFFRNLFQMLFIVAVMYAFGKVSVINADLTGKILPLLDGGALDINIMGLLPFAVQLLMYAWFVVVIKHATATTEYNPNGMDGNGMANYKVFMLLLFLTTIGFTVVCVLNKLDIVAPILMAAITLIGFLLDIAIHPKTEKAEKDVNVFSDDTLLGDYDDF